MQQRWVSSGIEPCEGSDPCVRWTATRASDAKPSASAARRCGRADQPFQTRPLRIETIDWYGSKCYAPGQENAGCSSIQGPRRKLGDSQQHPEPSIPGGRTEPSVGGGLHPDAERPRAEYAHRSLESRESPDRSAAIARRSLDLPAEQLHAMRLCCQRTAHSRQSRPLAAH